MIDSDTEKLLSNPIAKRILLRCIEVTRQAGKVKDFPQRGVWTSGVRVHDYADILRREETLGPLYRPGEWFDENFTESEQRQHLRKLRQLEKAGLVKITAGVPDSRNLFVKATKEGKQAAKAVSAEPSAAGV